MRETSTTTGTGALTLLGALTGYRAFADVCSVGDTFLYGISQRIGGEWELGVGTYSGVNTLTRTTVIRSSNSDAAVDFTAGTKDVFMTNIVERTMLKDGAMTAGSIPYIDANGELTNDNSNLFYDASNRRRGVGTSSPAAADHVVTRDAGTNSVITGQILSHNSSGTPATGFGVAMDFRLESTTTEEQDAARISAEWNIATHATRSADVAFYATGSGTYREGLRIRGGALAAAVGFFGVTPAGRASATTDIKDALTNYGLLQGTSASPLNLDGGALTTTGAASLGTTTTTGLTDTVTDATTDTVSFFIHEHNSTSTPATSFGAGILLRAESSTTVNRTLAYVAAYWVTATDASRIARATHCVADATTDREYLRGETNGSAAMIGFLGAAAVVRYATTGTTTGFTAGASTAVRVDATFTGNTGATAYTIGDIVRCLKLYGLMAS